MCLNESRGYLGLVSGPSLESDRTNLLVGGPFAGQQAIR